MPRLPPGIIRFLLALMTIAPAAANAQAFQVDARTEAQVYSMRAYRDTTPTDPVLLPRRRLVQYLSLDGYELITGQPLGFEASMRIFTDFGLPQGEAQKVDGLKTTDFDLLLANAYYKNTFSDGSALHVRIGRQTYSDVTEMLAFDGAYVRYVFKGGLGAEVYGGLWVKGSNDLSSSVYQPDGIRESDLRRVALMQAAPYAALDDIEPLVGAKLLAQNAFGTGVSASAGYRQSWLSGKIDTQIFTLDARWTKWKGIFVGGGLEYDLLMMRLGNARLLARYDGTDLAVSAELMHVDPIFAADSIFLYFATAQRDEARLRLDIYGAGPIRTYVALVGDSYGTNLNSTIPTAIITKTPMTPATTLSSPLSGGGNLGATFRSNGFRASADLTYKRGYGGTQFWADLAGGFTPEGGLFTLDARLSYANIRDSQNLLLHGDFFGAQIWGSWFLSHSTRASVMLEENVNPFTKSDTKVFLIFDWKVTI
ncbi:MAG: hypothetical protein QM723_11895 [Myxococcaceae bacterium]